MFSIKLKWPPWCSQLEELELSKTAIKKVLRFVGYIFSIKKKSRKSKQKFFYRFWALPPKAGQNWRFLFENLKPHFQRGKKLAIKLCLSLRKTQANWQLKNKKVEFSAQNQWKILAKNGGVSKFPNWSSFYDQARTYFIKNS